MGSVCGTARVGVPALAAAANASGTTAPYKIITFIFPS
jgi:hypothetical protein